MLCSSKVFLAFTDTCENLIIYVNPDVEFLKEEIYHKKNKKIYSFTENDVKISQNNKFLITLQYPKFFQLMKKKKQKKQDEKQEISPKKSVKIDKKLFQKTEV